MHLYKTYGIGLFDLTHQKVFAHRYNPEIHVQQSYFLPSDYVSVSPTKESALAFVAHLLDTELDADKLTQICSFAQIRKFSFKGKTYDGKEIHNYFYPVKHTDFKEVIVPQEYAWVDFDMLFKDKEQFSREIFDTFLSKKT